MEDSGSEQLPIIDYHGFEQVLTTALGSRSSDVRFSVALRAVIGTIEGNESDKR